MYALKYIKTVHACQLGILYRVTVVYREEREQLALACSVKDTESTRMQSIVNFKLTWNFQNCKLAKWKSDGYSIEFH